MNDELVERLARAICLAPATNPATLECCGKCSGMTQAARSVLAEIEAAGYVERARVIEECKNQARAGVTFGMTGELVEQILRIVDRALDDLKMFPFDPDEKVYRMRDTDRKG